MAEFDPRHVALEQTIYVQNFQTAQILGAARGAAIAAAALQAKEIFDVSGAGDTVIATFTLAIAAGASPIEAAILSNHAAGIVVGKIGTATTSPEELLKSFGI